ncbi:hypothetical protein F4780DRAFT_775506 [Xylariomycetidae sp. FL0641]|nr:hypothetical protein F4780DRAFT_775506 [Xylariomycetidae sp. FL0641]
MRYSTPLKSSPHCLPSPDGKHIAALLSSSLVIRATNSLAVTRTIKLPSGLAGSVTKLAWSPFSNRVLVAAPDHFHVFSAVDDAFHATVRIPSTLATKPPLIDFGATADEVCIWSPLGIKLTIVNLSTSKTVEISNPKLYNATSVPKSCRDMISIHAPHSRDVQRSWQPESIDAQGLTWSPDGSWLVVWESPAQGHRILVYTSDGHIFKDWRGPLLHTPKDKYVECGPGVRSLTFSPNGRHAAVADSSDCIYVLDGQYFAEEMRLCHPRTVRPRDTLQIWQEQANMTTTESSVPVFIKATQMVSPPEPPSNGVQEPKHGCSLAKFDSSSALLATRLDDSPSTVWIWDIPTSELRAVLMFHAPVAAVDWHPMQPELLLVRCERDKHSVSLFVWDPISHGPGPIDFASHFPCGKLSGQVHATWLKTETDSAALFLTDCASCMLVSLADLDEAVPWMDTASHAPPANAASLLPSVSAAVGDLDYEGDDMDESTGELDDTFHFKKNAGP